MLKFFRRCNRNSTYLHTLCHTGYVLLQCVTLITCFSAVCHTGCVLLQSVTLITFLCSMAH